MKPRVYVETSVVSYLTARPSRDVIMAGHQRSTQEWWSESPSRFELIASQLVVSEASAGDPDAASERLRILGKLQLLQIEDDVTSLAARLITDGAIPKEAADDALHIGLAVTNGIQYLVTWNFRHLANPAARLRIEAVCKAAGYEPTIICTPEELMEL